jgi:ribonuclease P protein component
VKGTIKRRRDFQAVYEHGQRAFGEHVVVFGLRTATGFAAAAAPRVPHLPDGNTGTTGPRVGIVASRKVGNAVRRNRAKRVLRAALHPLRPYLPAESWLVLVARSSLAQPDVRTQQVERELAALLVRLELMEDDPA